MGIIADIHNDLEKGAFQLLVEYRERLRIEAVKLCQDETGAEDLVFRTFEKVLSKPERFQDGTNLFGWMKAILTNLHRDDIKRPVVRGTQAVDAEELEKILGVDWSTTEDILRHSDCEAVRKAIQKLGPIYREPLLMQYYDGLSLKEIARILAVPIGTVSRRLHVAHRLIAGKLAAEFGQAKKPLAVILAALLGVGTLFGAWVSPLGDWVAEKAFGSAPAEVEQVESATQVEWMARSNSDQTFQATMPKTNESAISVTKKEGETNMLSTSKIGKTIMAASFAAMEMAAQGEVIPTELPIEATPWLHIDASNASTLETVTNPETGVVTLKSAKDASGGSRSVTAAGNSATTFGNYLGKPYFDFGPYYKSGSGAGLKWSEECKTIREAFLIVSDTPGYNEGFFIGGNDWHFHRGTSNGTLLGPASGSVSNGKIELDGNTATASTVLPSGFHLVRFQTTGNVEGWYFGIDRGSTRTGGIYLAEAVVFDATLSDDDAKAMTDYLIAKWLKPTDILNVECSMNLPVPEGVDIGCGSFSGLQAGDKRTLKTPKVWTNEVEKFFVTCTGWKLYDEDGVCLDEGPETTYEYVHPTPAAVRKFVWQVIPQHFGLALPPAVDTAFHVDASFADSLTVNGEGRVTKWTDSSFGVLLATQTAQGNSRLPTLGSIKGLPFVDFGPRSDASSPYLDWTVRDLSVREVFWVFSDYPGDAAGGILLGDSEGYCFERKNTKALVSSWVTGYILGGVIQVDGRTVKHDYLLPDGFHVIRVQTTGAVTAGTFARDRGYNSGGERLAEVLIYNRTLTDEEAKATTAYLMTKWRKLGEWNDVVLADSAKVELLGGDEATKTLYASRACSCKLTFLAAGDSGESGQTVSVAVDDGVAQEVQVLGAEGKKVSLVFGLQPGLHTIRLANLGMDGERKVVLSGFEAWCLRSGFAIGVK